MAEGMVVDRITVSTQEVCRMLGINRFRLYKMVAKKMIRPLAIQKRPYLFSRTEVDRMLKDMMGTQIYKED